MDYKQCSRCIMDTTDEHIYFNENGICNHCIRFEESQKTKWFPNKEGEKKLKNLFLSLIHI